MRRCSLLILVFVTAPFACGGRIADDSASGSSDAGSAQPLTCAWFSGPNCWSSAAATVASCLGSSPGFGKFSADRNTCTEPDGSTVTFQTPPPSPPINGGTDLASYLLNFTITRDGSLCAQVSSPSRFAFSLTTSAGTVSSYQDDSTLRLTCPDGTTYSATGSGPNGWGEALPCLSQGPSIDFGGGGTTFEATLGGGGVSPGIGLFSCE